MSNWIKYLIFSLLFVVVAIFIIFVSVRHQTNIISTQEVEGALPSVSIGDTRTENAVSLDLDSLVSNVLLSIANSHKEQGKDIQVDYVFLDGDGNVTNDDVQSIQFEVKLLGKNGRVESTSRENIEIDYLEDKFGR